MATPKRKATSALGDGAPPPARVLRLVPTVGFPIVTDDAGKARGTGHDRWAPTTPDDLEWAMSMLAQYTVEIETAEDRAEQWHARVDAWLATETAGARFWADVFEAKLEAYARRFRTDKQKSFTTPSGKITTTRTAPAVQFINDDAADDVIEWATAEELDVGIETKQRVLITALREHVDVIDRAVFVGDQMVVTARIMTAVDETTAELVEVGVDEDDQIIEGGTIVEGPFVVHRESGIIVPGVTVTDEKISVQVKPATPTPAT